MNQAHSLAERLHRQIERSRWTVVPGERQLARELEVSRGSVRGALARLRADGVLLHSEGRGHVVAGSGVAPRRIGRTRRKLIGYPLWVEHLSDLDLFRSQGRLSVLDGIRAELERAGCELDVQWVGPEGDPDRPKIKALCRRWDAVILEPFEHARELTAEHPFAPLRARTVVIGHVQEGGQNCVRPDFRQAGTLAMNHLVTRGAKRLLFTGDDRERNANFLLEVVGLEQAGARPGVEITFGQTQWFVEDGYNAVRQALDRGVRFDAVVANTPYAGMGALRALFEHRRRVPDEVQVVALGSVAALRYLCPRLTAVDLDLAEVGRAAAQLARVLIANDGAPQASRTVPVFLVPGETTREGPVGKSAGGRKARSVAGRANSHPRPRG